MRLPALGGVFPGRQPTSQETRSDAHVQVHEPAYKCDTPLAPHLEQLRVRLAPCADIVVSGGEVTAVFKGEGCQIDRLTLSGKAALAYEVGGERLTLAADLRQLSVSGTPLQSIVSYGRCGGGERIAVQREGSTRGGRSWPMSLT